MTIKECIDIVDNIKPNQYTVKEKVGWLSFIDEIIINDVLKTHEGYDGRYDDFEGYSEDKLSVILIVPSPYDRLYTAYLKMKIDGENGEMARYNNSAELFNTYMMEYRKHYNKTHMPLDVTKRDNKVKIKQAPSTLPDAVIENITRELYAMLSEDFAEMTSQDRIYSIVTSYMQNNAAMLKGKDGYTPEKGVDYFDGEDGIGIAKISQTVTSPENGGTNTILVTMTDGGTYRFYVKNGEKGDKPVVGVDYYTAYEQEAMKRTVVAEVREELETYIDEQTEIIKTDVEGLQKQINEEAHFRGYLSTTAKIQALEATPNDFAYSAESNTKWVYDDSNGWQDTGVAVPDQLTPASDTTPLINGTASVGEENAYARGDHRHPTDTTRASVEQLNKAKSELENEIDACGDFELVASDELTEKVGVIDLTLPNQYKELYLRFTIPPSEEAAAGSASTEKARFVLHTLNDSATYINKVIYNQGNQFIQDYTAEWYAGFRIQIFGNSNNAYCRTELWYETTFYATGGYARGMNSGTYSGYVAPSVPMVRDYIKRLKISFMTSGSVTDGSVRYLPIGTKYELWGVRK